MDARPPLRLTVRERDTLQAWTRAADTKPALRTRAMIVLLSAAGQTGRAIGTVVGVTRRTVCNVRARWRSGRLTGLADAPRPGRPPLADARYVRTLLRVVRTDPRDVGYAFARWTAPRLVEHLAQRTGARVTADWGATLLKRHGFVWRRTKLTTRNLQHPRAVARAADRLHLLKKGRRAWAPSSNSGLAMGCASISCP